MNKINEYLLSMLTSKRIKETDIGDTTIEILKYIAVNPSTSIYDCFKYLKNEYNLQNKTIAYKNVHIKVHKLFQFGLIQKVIHPSKNYKVNTYEPDENANVEERRTKHGAIYYSITPAGIFHLFNINADVIDKEVILKNKEDKLFKNFLYPYIDLYTLEKLNFEKSFSYIYKFLNKCCYNIENDLDRLRDIEENGGSIKYLGYTDNLTNPKLDWPVMCVPPSLLSHIKEKFNIKWISADTAKIIELEKNKLIKIIDDKNNQLTLKIYPEKNVAVLLDKDRIIEEFELKKHGTRYMLTDFIPTDVEDFIDDEISINDDDIEFHYDLNSHVDEFGYSMLKYVCNSTHIFLPEEDRLVQNTDRIVIAKDKKFQIIVSRVKSQFDSYYEDFMNLRSIENCPNLDM
jgi:hypothetical protein